MKKLDNISKYLIGIIIGILIGIILSMAIVHAAQQILSSNDITYNNANSGGKYTRLNTTLNELYEKVMACKESKNIVKAYKYDQTNTSSKCITGDESTCKISTCYKNKSKNSCPAGTIIDYLVNDREIVRFHVMFDQGSQMTLQSQKNIVVDVLWGNTKSRGPISILGALESAVDNWYNVKEQTYQMGITNLSGQGVYTGCTADFECRINSYTFSSQRKEKARMITLQEAMALGCNKSDSSCPIWMYNYLHTSTSYKGTVDDSPFSYWTMSAYTEEDNAWYIGFYGHPDYYSGNITVKGGARAVIVVNK